MGLFLDIFLSYIISSVEELPITAVVLFHGYYAFQSPAKTTLVAQFNGDSNPYKSLINW